MGGPEKPKKPYNALGPQVQVKVKQLENDPWAQEALRAVGDSMAQDGMTYLGSACIHFYSTERTILTTKQEGAYKYQFALGDMQESFVLYGAYEFLKAIGRKFGREQKTNDPNYKVET